MSFNDPKLTIILPAAGKGARLNLPYPKEIYQIERGKALIDFSFDLFSNVKKERLHFIIIINEKKTDIVKYLAKYKERFYISLVYQNPKELEYTGAIKSAKYLFSDRNLVLLPDTKIELPSNLILFDEIHEMLKRNNCAFLFKKETCKKILKTKGSLMVNHQSKIKAYEDKPTKNFLKFNGYWCGFAFKKKIFEGLISFMEKSTLKSKKITPRIDQSPMYNSPVIEVKDFKDYGTWDSINK